MPRRSSKRGPVKQWSSSGAYRRNILKQRTASAHESAPRRRAPEAPRQMERAHRERPFALLIRSLTSVEVSHPCAKKKEQGWGTGESCSHLNRKRSSSDARLDGWEVGGGGMNRSNPDRVFALSDEKKKKRGVPRPHAKHAAWELLSPDLRCFCTHLVEIASGAQRYGRIMALGNHKGHSIVMARCAQVT